MKTNQLDKLIERAYYRLACGRQIDIMKISKLFAEARLLILAGSTVDNAVQSAIDSWCEPLKKEA